MSKSLTKILVFVMVLFIAVIPAYSLKSVYPYECTQNDNLCGTLSRYSEKTALQDMKDSICELYFTNGINCIRSPFTDKSGIVFKPNWIEKEGFTDIIPLEILLKNTSDIELDLKEIKISYYFTSDGISMDNLSCRLDSAAYVYGSTLGDIIINGKDLTSNFDKMVDPNHNPFGDTELNINFNNSNKLKPGGAIEMHLRIISRNNQLFNLFNDYSYIGIVNPDYPNSFVPVKSSDGAVHNLIFNGVKFNRVPVYYKGLLITSDNDVFPTPTPTPSPKPTGTKMIKVAGFVMPELSFDKKFSDEVLKGFEINISEAGKSVQTSVYGYFEISIPDSLKEINISISKPGCLTRIFKVAWIVDDFTMGSRESPVMILPGDMNQDGAINMSDVMEVSKNFGSRAGELNYRKISDLNYDGAVNFTDIMIAAKYFNKTSGDYRIYYNNFIN